MLICREWRTLSKRALLQMTLACAIVEGMELKIYLQRERGQTGALARHLGVASAWVSQWASGIRPIPPRYVRGIVTWTKGEVREWDLVTEWHQIWPELRGDPSSPSVPLVEGASS